MMYVVMSILIVLMFLLNDASRRIRADDSKNEVAGNIPKQTRSLIERSVNILIESL
jgi:uncharacterized membrane protein